MVPEPLRFHFCLDNKQAFVHSTALRSLLLDHMSQAKRGNNKLFFLIWNQNTCNIGPVKQKFSV